MQARRLPPQTANHEFTRIDTNSGHSIKQRTLVFISVDSWLRLQPLRPTPADAIAMAWQAAAATTIPGSDFSLAPRTRRDCETRAVLRRCATLVPELPSFPSRSGAKTIQLEFLRPTDNRA